MCTALDHEQYADTQHELQTLNYLPGVRTTWAITLCLPSCLPKLNGAWIRSMTYCDRFSSAYMHIRNVSIWSLRINHAVGLRATQYNRNDTDDQTDQGPGTRPDGPSVGILHGHDVQPARTAPRDGHRPTFVEIWVQRQHFIRLCAMNGHTEINIPCSIVQ